MKKIVTLLACLGLALGLSAQTTPIKNGKLQSNMDGAGFGLGNTTGEVFPNPLINSYDGSDDYDVGRGRTPNLILSLLYSNSVNYFIIGDSRGNDFFAKMMGFFDTYTSMPTDYAAWQIYPYWWERLGSFAGTAASFTNVPALNWNPFTLIVLRPGEAHFWASGASHTGGASNVNRLDFYFYGGSTNGSCDIYTTPMGTPVFTKRVVVNETLYPGYICATNLALTAGNYRAMVSNTTSANVYYRSLGFVSTSVRRSRIYLEVSGGQEMGTFLAMGTNTIASMLTNHRPTVILYPQTKLVTSYSNFPKLRYLFNTFATNADVGLVLMSPGTNLVASASTNEGSFYQLQDWRPRVRSYSWFLIDMMSPMNEPLRSVNRGFVAHDGVGIHLSPVGIDVFGSIFLEKLGLVTKYVTTGNFSVQAAINAAYLPSTNGASYGMTNFLAFRLNPSNDRVGDFGVIDSSMSGWWIGHVPSKGLGPNDYSFGGNQSGTTFMNSSNAVSVAIDGTPQLYVFKSGGILTADPFNSFVDPGSGVFAFNLTAKVKGNLQIRSNTGPTSVTVGTTAPDQWLAIQGTNGVQFYVPAWVPH